MPHSDTLFLAHMLECARKAASRARHSTFEKFADDENLHLACIHLVQMVGEAATRVSSERRARYSEIPWRQIAGMRNRIVHNYLEVDLEIMWQVISRDFPNLVVSLEQAIADERSAR